MKLALLEFVKHEPLFEARKQYNYQPDPIPEVTRVNHNGDEWLAYRQLDTGWAWIKLSGRSPRNNRPILFPWGDDIYKEPRYDKRENLDLSYIDLPVNQSTKTASKNTKDKIVDIPEELRNPEAACNYARFTLGTVWPDGEYYIAQSPKYAYIYANRFLKPLGKRFWKAEPTIATKLDWAVPYAIDIMKERWPAIEPKLNQYPYLVAQYSNAFNLTYNPDTNTFRQN